MRWTPKVTPRPDSFAWNLWFAWRLIKIADTTWVWWEWIERKIIITNRGDTLTIVYRFIEENTR